MLCYSQKVLSAIIITALLILIAVQLRTAWMCDDAYITLRTVDNFINGHGLTWNVGERVQAYTHPLWMFLLSFAYLFTREAFYTTIILSIVLSLASIAFAALKVARSWVSGVMLVLAVTLSKAFTDFSTSGLENPLSYLLLVSFMVVYFRDKHNDRAFLGLCLLASLAMLTRLDHALIYLPPLCYLLVQGSTPRRFMAGLMGFLPLVVWELFSLFYYGFLFPNTAFAKLNTGIEGSLLWEQGITYLVNLALW
ncbi:MAG: hypothetical protein KOO62_07495 [candidate division Zixibacteria bacterium]|nr:hypothetical protein [candidate division Zixibacteria bacterium]